MERYCAAMLLLEAGSGVGYHGAWRRGSLTQQEEVWGGLERVLERAEKGPQPLDLLMHVATAEALLAGMKSQHTFCKEAARRCLIAMEKHLSGQEDKRNATKTRTDSGAAAAVRGLSVGMRFPRPDRVAHLLHAAVECGRMTHTCPTGFLGCVCMALFASYAAQGQPPPRWGRLMLGALPLAEQYCRQKPAIFTDYSENWLYFETKWQLYLQLRGIDREGRDEPFFPENYDTGERNKLYRHWFAVSPGRQRGVAITLMVYDAILTTGGDWTLLCQWALCHGGVSEGTGSILGCLYGLLHGSLGVPSTFLLNLGLREQMEALGAALYSAAYGERTELGDESSGDDPASSVDDPTSPSESHGDLWRAVKRLSCKRADDQINTLLNYLALLEQGGAARRRDRGQPSEGGGKGRRGQGTVRPSHAFPSRFQLLRSRFTKLGHRDDLHRLRPPAPERPITRLRPPQAKSPSQREKESRFPPITQHGHAFCSDSASSPLIGRQTERCQESRALIGQHGEGLVAEAACGGFNTPGRACVSTETGTPRSPAEHCILPSRVEFHAPPSKGAEFHVPPSRGAEFHVPPSKGVEFQVPPCTRTDPPESTALESPLQRTGPESHSEKTEPESTPKRTGPEPTPKRTGPESTPKRTGPESTPKRTGPESTPKGRGPESTPKRTGPESTPKGTGPESNPKITGPESTPKGTGPESTPKRTGPESTPKGTGPESTPKRTGPESTPKGTGPESTPKGTGPESTPKRTGPESTPKGTGPESNPKITGPESTPKGTGPESTPKGTEPESTPKRTGPESTPKGRGPESTPKGTEPESTPKRTGPESTPKETGLESLSTRRGSESPPERTGPESPPETEGQCRMDVPPPSLCTDSSHSPKPLPWKYRTHCYAKELGTPPAPKVLLSVGMRGGRLVKTSYDSA